VCLAGSGQGCLYKLPDSFTCLGLQRYIHYTDFFFIVKLLTLQFRYDKLNPMSIFMTKRKVDREDLRQKILDAQRENEEIRKLIDDLRSRGEKVNYAAIGRQYNLSRQRIEQIDKNR
jgi:hypothetical protein